MQDETLLNSVRRQFPELEAEDAFLPPLWYPSQLSWIEQPGSCANAAYNYPLAARLRGALDPACLQSALDQLLRRHATLRSAFRMMGRRAVQITCPATPVEMTTFDLSETEPAKRDQQANHLAAWEAHRPFSLLAAPQFRALLIRFAAADHVLVMTTHHAVCDDWSAGILLQEFALLYRSAVCGCPADLPQLDFQYADFARWQQREEVQRAMSEHQEFWSAQLREASGAGIHIKEDYPRPPMQSFRGSHARAVICNSALQSIVALSRQRKTTLFMTLLAAFQSLLSSYSNHPIISTGCCVANRELLEVRPLVGPFANVIVLRTPIDKDCDFREVVQRTRETALDAYSHQAFPFGELVQSFGPIDPARHNPFFQFLFVLQNASRQSWEVPGLLVESYPLDTTTSVYDLNLSLRIDEQLDLDLQYNSDLFKAETARQILIDYEAVLELVGRAPEVRIADLLVPELRVQSGKGTSRL